MVRSMVSRVLILGGTAEAAALASQLVARFADRLEVTTSLAGRLPANASAPPSAGRLRVGGFGGAAGLANWLADESIDLLVDATHPFAATISAHAAAAGMARGIPWIRLVRPPWPRCSGDRWLEVADLEAAATLLPSLARRVFLATGPRRVEAFATLPDVWFLVRAFAPPPAPLPLAYYTLVVAQPPFTVESETALLLRHAIGAVVAKQSGGPTAAKLAAARDLSLPVVMITRPSLPPATEVETVEAAVAWIDATLNG